MNKYKILWLDDLFEPSNNTMDSVRRISCEAFVDELEYLKEQLPIDVDTIWNINQFSDYVPNIKSYQAVIFDLRGLNPDDSLDVMPMAKAYRQIKDSGVLVYVFSANIGDRDFNSSSELYELKQSGRCFSKTDRVKGGKTDMELLLDRIVKDLNFSLNFYEGHEDCLNIFKEGWLDSASRPEMDSILSIHHERNYLELPADKMRKIMEMIAHKLIDITVLKPGTKTTIKQWTKCFYDSYNSKGIDSDGKPIWDFDNPVIPYELCGKDVRVMMEHLAVALDQNNHYFKAISDDGVRQHIWSSVYDAFFVVIWWFDWFMKLFHGYHGDFNKYVTECRPKDVVAKMPTPSQAPLKKIWFKEGGTYKGTLIPDREDENKMRVFVEGAPFPPEAYSCVSSNLKLGDEVTFVAHKIDSYWVATDVK